MSIQEITKAIRDYMDASLCVNGECKVKMNQALQELEGMGEVVEIPKTGIGDLSDGFHTFNGLYRQRMILFAALVKHNQSLSWKSYRHEDGEYCFGGGWFIVGIDTPKGSYTYHYENEYWNLFDCVELPKGKHWDGHTEKDAEIRLMSLGPKVKTEDDAVSKVPSVQPQMEWIPCSERMPEMHEENGILRKFVKQRSKEVLVTIKDNKNNTYFTHSHCELWDGKWHGDIFRWLDAGKHDYTAIAWMPLPEPFKEVDNG